MDPQNLMSTLQQLSNLSGANLTSQMALNQFGGDLSSLPWPSGQAWLDSAKMAAMYNIIQTASVNDQVQQLNTINAMNSFEQSLKLLAQQTTNATLPQSQTNMDQLATAQSDFQNRLAMESMLQNDTLSALLQTNLQQQHQVSTPSTSLNDTNTTSLAHLLQNTSNADFLASNLQNTMSSILALTNKTPSSTSSSALSMTTEQELFNAAANHLNNLQATSLQNPFEKSTKKSSKEHKKSSSSANSANSANSAQPSTSQATNSDESVNQAHLLSQISQSNLLVTNPTNDQTYLPATSANNPFITQNIPTNNTIIDDFDLNELHDMFFDKTNSKPKELKSFEQMASTSANFQNISTNQTNELDLDHFASITNGEFDFDEKSDHEDKLFDSLKFLKEIGGGADRDSPEPEFNQAELEPVQFTPPDSPQHHHSQLKFESLVSPTTSNKSSLLQKSIQDLPKHPTNEPSLPLFDKQSRMESKSSMNMPLVFIPPVQTSVQPKKSINEPNNSSLLQRSNKLPIYKQKFVNLTSGVQEKQGEDCYSFVDDEFDLPMSTPKPSTSSVKIEQEPIIASTVTTKSNEKSEKQLSANQPAFVTRRLAKLKEHKEPRQFGTPWFTEFISRQEKELETRWVSVNPFECTELKVDKTYSDLEWTADRSVSFKKNSIRLVIKEEPVVVESSTEEARRPRLVLKFFKPKTEENLNQEPLENHEDKHSKKHKKHKRKHKDDDYEYPGEVKKHKKEKKHKHHSHKRHRVKSEVVECEDDEDSQPAFNTRSALSIKTEHSDHTSPSHSSHSSTIQNAQKQSNDLSCLIGGRLMDEHFIKRLNSFSQTQSDLPKGIFVVAKDEVWKEECPLWRIDSQNLLQKFVLCDENPGCYTNTSNYTGWCDDISQNYFIVHVQHLKQSRSETIVKPLHPIENLFPALPTEDPSILCGEDDEENVEFGVDLIENPQNEFIGTVVELLLKQCSDPNTLEETYKTPDSKSAKALQEFQNRCFHCIDEIQIEEMIRTDVCMLLDTYSSLITFEHQENDENECLGCGSGDDLLKIGLHSGEKYDPILLTIQEGIDENVFGNGMDFPVCKKCADQIQFYHRNRHAFFHLLKKCENQFIDLTLERPSATSNALLNLSLKNKTFIKTVSNEFARLWAELPKLIGDIETSQ